MTVVDVDVVVVGAGPAGSAAAISLAERGRRVLLLDKATFPRDKVCGDFLSPRSLAVLAELGCGDAVRRAQPRRIRRSMIHLNGELISHGPVPQVGDLPGHGLVVPRVTADEILVRRAAAVGAEVVEGFTATGLAVHGDGITVHGRRATGPASVDARLAVVADGARSRLAAGLGIAPVSGQKDPFALRAYLRDVPCAPDAAGIFFGTDYFPGFAWVFPTGDGGANVGMGMQMGTARHYGINLRDRFLHWLQADPGARAMLGAPRKSRIVGWPLPAYQGVHGNHADRVLVVGDAGWFVDPLNGEGIHTALESARLAASVADEALTTGDLGAGALATYERRWRARFGLDLQASDLIVAIAQNRDLLPLWLLALRMAAQRSMDDPGFAATWGGIMAGVVPAHHGLSLELAVQSALQRPGFWWRHQGEILEALAALAGRGADRDQAEPAGWMRDVVAKWMAVSNGLTEAYGVPWATGRRPLRARVDQPQRALPTIVLDPADRTGRATP